MTLREAAIGQTVKVKRLTGGWSCQEKNHGYGNY